MEELYPITDYEGLYSITKSGDVFSNRRNRFMLLDISNMGYYRLSLYRDGASERQPVHRLVAKTFLPNLQNKKTVNHKDGNKANNNVENLEWCSQSENIQHAYNTNLKNGRNLRKLNRKQAGEIREKYKTKQYSLRGLGKEYGLSFPTIRNIIQKITYKEELSE